MTRCHRTIGGTSVKAKLGGRTALVTGATSGIGKRAAIGLGALGARVVVVARDRERGRIMQQEIRRESGNDAVELLVADLVSQRDVRGLAAEFRARHDRLDLLVNGVNARFAERGTTQEGLERTFAVNYLAAFQLTDLLLDELRNAAPARVLNIVPRIPRGVHLALDDLQGARVYTGSAAVAQSALATILWTYELASRLDGSGITVNCLERGRRWRSRRGARSLLQIVTDPELEVVSAECFSASGAEKRTSNETYDPAIAAQLWEESQRLTGALVPA